MVRVWLIHSLVLFAGGFCCAGVVEDTNVIFRDFEAPVDPPWIGFEITDMDGVGTLDCGSFTNLDSFAPNTQCLANQTDFYSVDAGDPFSLGSIFSGAYPRFTEFAGTGDFYVGFVTGGGLIDETEAIGWMYLRRTDATVEMLGNAVSYSLPPDIVPGIYVGTPNLVPEPSPLWGAVCGALFILTSGRSRVRKTTSARSLCILAVVLPGTESGNAAQAQRCPSDVDTDASW